MLSQLVYVSKRATNCDEQELQKILGACQLNNQRQDITGVLLYSSTHFVQYLEGKYRQIMELYDIIKADPRHTQAVMVSNGIIEQRVFPSWQMGAKQMNEDTVHYKSEMPPEQLSTFQDILAGKRSENQKTISIIKRLFK